MHLFLVVFLLFLFLFLFLRFRFRLLLFFLLLFLLLRRRRCRCRCRLFLLLLLGRKYTIKPEGPVHSIHSISARMVPILENLCLSRHISSRSKAAGTTYYPDVGKTTCFRTSLASSRTNASISACSFASSNAACTCCCSSASLLACAYDHVIERFCG